MTDDPKDPPKMDDEKKVPSKLKMPADWDESLDGEWDDEYASEEALAQGADIQLIIEYLNKRLEPERMEEVRRRLEGDAAFAELAEPLIFVWKIPKHIVRHPRPAGELERSWEEFTKRVGIHQPPRKPRRRRPWLLLVFAFVVLGAIIDAASAPIREWYVIRRDFAVVPHEQNPGWIPLGDSVFAQPDPGASLRSSRETIDGARRVLLDGTARFRSLALDSATADPRRAGIVVMTRGGQVSAGEAEFTVTTRADTAEVEVQRPSVRRFMFGFIPIPTGVSVRSDSAGEVITLRELDRARMVRGQRPTRLTPPLTEKEP